MRETFPHGTERDERYACVEEKREMASEWWPKLGRDFV